MKHGDAVRGKKVKLYQVWRDMKNRCLNEKHKFYGIYGGRGIKISSLWIDDYIAFREWSLKSGYEEGLSIDRIDNDGNYEPSNCRWVDQATQMCNTRRLRSNNKSGYRGVAWDKSRKKYRAFIVVNKKMIFLGRFDCPIEGAKARDEYIIKHNLEHTRNFE